MLTGGFAAPPNSTDRRGTPGGRPYNAFRELSNGIGIYSGCTLLTRPLNTGDASDLHRYLGVRVRGASQA